MWKEAAMAQFQVLFLHLTAESEEGQQTFSQDNEHPNQD
jgi:hypothetical protein